MPVKGPLIPLEQLELLTGILQGKRHSLTEQSRILSVGIEEAIVGRAPTLHQQAQLEMLGDDEVRHIAEGIPRLRKLLGMDDSLQAKRTKLGGAYGNLKRLPERRILQRELRKVRERIKPGTSRRTMRLERWRALDLAPESKLHWRLRPTFGGKVAGEFGGPNRDPGIFRYLSHTDLDKRLKVAAEDLAGGITAGRTDAWAKSIEGEYAALLKEKARRVAEEHPKTLSRRGFLAKAPRTASQPTTASIETAATKALPKGGGLLLRILSRGRVK